MTGGHNRNSYFRDVPRNVVLVLICLALLATSVVALAALSGGESPSPAIAPAVAAAPSPAVAPAQQPDPEPQAEAAQAPKPPAPLSPRQRLHRDLLAALGTSTAADFSAVVEVEGLGRVLDVKGDVSRMPASTLKLYTGMAALRVLGADFRYLTELRSTAEINGGVLDGDLVLVGGGDPSLTREDLKMLANRLAAVGVSEISGDLYADESRYDRVRGAPGWRDRWFPRYVGTLSALTVDRNAWSDRPGFYAQPALANVSLLRLELAAAGIEVAGVDRLGSPAGTVRLASHRSAPLGEMMKEVLAISDNVYSELMLKELGRTAGTPTTSGGLAVVHREAAELGIPSPVHAADGSGLSFHDRDMAYNQIALLKEVESSEIGRVFRHSLARSCTEEVGFFGTRLCGTPAAERVFAKTGVHVAMRALSGYTETASGRRVYFAFNLQGIRDVEAVWKAMMQALVVVNTYGG